MHFRAFLLFLLFLLFLQFSSFAQKRHTIHGTISDAESKEILINASIYNPTTKTGVVTNAYGFYSIDVYSSTLTTLEYSFVGYQKQSFSKQIWNDTLINIELSPVMLNEVEIKSDREGEKLLHMKPGLIKIDNSAIENSVAFFGEHDPLSYLQTIPGISSTMEGNNYFSVRGGGPDQNLIILDDAPIYNTNHLLGYFSNINDDIIKNIDVWKGTSPAIFGGKLSSVIDIQTKEGDKSKYHSSLGIGLIATKFMIEGPIKKNVSSFILAIRRSNLDFILPLVRPDLTDYKRYHFMDINLKTNVIINSNNRVFYSGYYGIDKFTEPGKTDKVYLKWYNATSTLRWTHIYNSKLFSHLTALYSRYYLENYEEESYQQQTNYYKYLTQIEGIALKHDIEWYPNSRYQLKTGVHYDMQWIRPAAIITQGIPIPNSSLTIKTYGVNTLVFYADASLFLSDRMNITIGDRFTTCILTQNTSFINEPRISANYQVTPNFYLTSNYSKTSQPIHVLTNTGLGTPSDMWVPATKMYSVETGQQFSIGFKSKINKLFTLITFDGYYKTMNNIIGYKPTATFLTLSSDPSKIHVPNWEDNVTTGKSDAYGIEVLIKQQSSRLSIMVGYTLAWVTQQFPEINNGHSFYASYDRRHKINLNCAYTFKRNKSRKESISIGSNWIFASGKPISLPYSSFYLTSLGTITGVTVIETGPYNGFRLNDYHRLDLSIKLTRTKSNFKRIWEFGIYNVYNRMNPYKYTLNINANGNGGFDSYLQQTSYFPILPYITLTIKL